MILVGALAIRYHDTLHGFRTGCGTETSTLEANMLQQMMYMREEVLCTIFLYLHKAYDALYRYICLDILTGCDVSPRAIRIFHKYWERLQMVVKAGGYFAPPFKGFRGVAHGDPLSPTTFNEVVGALIGHFVTEVAPTEAV